MNGTVAVSGMALAPARLVIEAELDVSLHRVERAEEETERLRLAVEMCAEELTNLICQLREDRDTDHAGILDFQLLLLEDDSYIGRIRRTIQEEKANCEYAVAHCSQAYREELTALDNPYLNERSADITDIEKRLLRSLSGRKTPQSEGGHQIAVAIDLTPSQVVEMGRQGLRGIVLEKGGLSSHCVILARSMNIPCVIGVPQVTAKVREGQTLLLDAEAGKVTVEPDEGQIGLFKEYQQAAQAEQASLEQYRQAETVTADGKTMKVYANITSDLEAQALLKQGGEGVGLLRTEMLYMERDTAPDEETQYEIYSNIVKALDGRPLIVRTLDVGGDKHIAYLGIPDEDNPFLGYRAIRYCLDHPEVFRVQIAAVLRAAALGPVQLMLPMVSALSEVEQAKEVIAAVRRDLDARCVRTGPVSIGMMVETPAAAVMADRFAEAVDFFSIGTNDLTQYLFAADRNNTKVAALNSYFQPALLRMIERICRCAHENHIEVGICGQAGEVEELIPLWVGMGVDELSVSIPSIPRVRRAIRRCDTEACRRLVNQAQQCASENEVKQCVKEEVEKWS